MISKERLRRGGLVKEQPPGSEEHVVRVPRLRAVEENVSSVERTAERRVVRWEERVDGVEDVLRDGRGVNEELFDECVERRVFLGGGHVQVAHDLAEDGAFVQLVGV